MKLVGAILIVLAVAEPLVAFFVILPRVPDEQRRRILMMAIGISSFLMLVLGGVMVSGVLG